MKNIYNNYFNCIRDKNIEGLMEILAEDFVFVHESGLKIPRDEYIFGIMNNELTYKEINHDDISFDTRGGRGVMEGKTRIKALDGDGNMNAWTLNIKLFLRIVGDKVEIIKALY